MKRVRKIGINMIKKYEKIVIIVKKSCPCWPWVFFILRLWCCKINHLSKLPNVPLIFNYKITKSSSTKSFTITVKNWKSWIDVIKQTLFYSLCSSQSILFNWSNLRPFFDQLNQTHIVLLKSNRIDQLVGFWREWVRIREHCYVTES